MWDVSNVTDMSGMYVQWCLNVQSGCDMSVWDVSNVTDMSGMMFSGASMFNQDVT